VPKVDTTSRVIFNKGALTHEFGDPRH